MDILQRKIIAASISGSIFAVLLGIIVPNPFGEEINSLTEYLFLSSLSIPVYILYSFPVILIYGVITSIISDWLAKRVLEKYELYTSASLHILFGLVLLWFSLGAAVLFFVVDRLLMKRSDIYLWKQALLSLLIPMIVWLIFMGIVWLEHLISN
ncbi:hypothetical protein ACTWQB_09285 [Piscibacillus sp. B03]|uniref:hypothetical protein n=1 Tax=Piscibacillus sp. B03 TaxID=3457430 RepID=UPI003FCD85BE